MAREWMARECKPVRREKLEIGNTANVAHFEDKWTNCHQRMERHFGGLSDRLWDGGSEPLLMNSRKKWVWFAVIAIAVTAMAVIAAWLFLGSRTASARLPLI
jgi:hypothetical protein